MNGEFTSGNNIPDMTELEILDITHKMLRAIHEGDAETYRMLCLSDLSCFETDVAPYRIDGIDFHIDLIHSMKQADSYEKLVRFDILTPRVQLWPGFAIITYTRLMTYMNENSTYYRTFNETRVFVLQGQSWKMAHFHRSNNNSIDPIY
jgi:hypothetical protein